MYSFGSNVYVVVVDICGHISTNQITSSIVAILDVGREPNWRYFDNFQVVFKESFCSHFSQSANTILHDLHFVF